MRALLARLIPPRRYRRWTLRGLLLLVSVLCVYLAWLRHCVYREYAAAQELARRGYAFNYRDDAGRVEGIRAPRQNASLTDVQSWWSLLGPEWENYGLIGSAEATRDSRPDDIACLHQLSQLKGVMLRGDAIGDRDAEVLLSRRSVTNVVFDRCNLTTKSVDMFNQHDELKFLRFRNTLVFEGMSWASFRPLPQCEVKFEEIPDWNVPDVIRRKRE